jgi:hypothetical protein
MVKISLIIQNSPITYGDFSGAWKVVADHYNGVKLVSTDGIA